MNIHNVEMQFQSDSRLARLEICRPPWQKYFRGSMKGMDDPDYFGEFGCYGTAGVNCYNDFNKGLKPFMSIKDYNALMIQKKGYEFVYYLDVCHGDLDEVKKKCLNRESFLRPVIFAQILGIKNILDIAMKDVNLVKFLNPNYYYVIKTAYQNTGHYSRVLNDKLEWLDSYDGKIKPYVKDNTLGFKLLVL